MAPSAHRRRVPGHEVLTGGPLVVTRHGRFLRDLLPHYGLTSIAALRRRLGLRKQYAWLLWHGKIALSVDMMRRLHGELGIPLEALMQVERAEPAKRRGRPPQRCMERGGHA
jgi:transcriptional regulator with XRE-family HTH domain